VYEDDNRITVVCDDGAVEDIVKNKIDVIKNVLEDKYKKTFEIKTTNRTEHESWEKLMGMAEDQSDEGEEIYKLQSQFPDADFE
jgi:hypothetical protein